MQISEMMQRLCIDGAPVRGVVQATIDQEQTTLVYDVPRDGGEPARRVITVETEAVTVDPAV